jgi:hypothetical protein
MRDCSAAYWIADESKVLRLLELSWRSLSAVSWVVHINHESFQQTNDLPCSFPPPRPSVYIPMSPFLFLVSLALTATLHSARAQTTTTATSSAFTPLASKSFDWNNLVRFPLFRQCKGSPISVESPIKPTPTTAFVAFRTVTIAAIRPMRTKNRSAKPLSSTRSMVCDEAFPFPILPCVSRFELSLTGLT